MRKECFKCNVTKDLSEYYKHPEMKDGHLNKCKECTKKDVSTNVKANAEYYKEYEKLRAMLPHRVKARKEYSQSEKGKLVIYQITKKWRKKNPEKHKAHCAVNNALRDGKISKEPCKMCGNEKSNGHHHDYSKPLDVTWLCSTCHRFQHKKESLKMNKK